MKLVIFMWFSSSLRSISKWYISMIYPRGSGNVCYIWQHLPSIYPSFVRIYTIHTDPMGMVSLVFLTKIKAGGAPRHPRPVKNDPFTSRFLDTIEQPSEEKSWIRIIIHFQRGLHWITPIIVEDDTQQLPSSLRKIIFQSPFMRHFFGCTMRTMRTSAVHRPRCIPMRHLLEHWPHVGGPVALGSHSNEVGLIFVADPVISWWFYGDLPLVNGGLMVMYLW